MVVWGLPTIVLLLGTGVYLTLILKGVQFRKLGPALRLALVRRKEEGAEGDITHYQALMTALAATVRVGNIAGVATAIATGGPGALFWMWIRALFGLRLRRRPHGLTGTPAGYRRIFLPCPGLTEQNSRERGRLCRH